VDTFWDWALASLMSNHVGDLEGEFYGNNCPPGFPRPDQ
jgi:hypothetical protein